MIWEDECYLLSKRKFRENANIINIFTKEKGKVDGIVYGGTSRKIRNYLQISNKLFIVHNSKSENKLGYFKTELVKAISPLSAWTPKTVASFKATSIARPVRFVTPGIKLIMSCDSIETEDLESKPAPSTSTVFDASA